MWSEKTRYPSASKGQVHKESKRRLTLTKNFLTKLILRFRIPRHIHRKTKKKSG